MQRCSWSRRHEDRRRLKHLGVLIWHVWHPPVVVGRGGVVGVRRGALAEESRGTSVGAKTRRPGTRVSWRSADRRGGRPGHRPSLNHAGPGIMRRVPGRRRGRCWRRRRYRRWRAPSGRSGRRWRGRRGGWWRGRSRRPVHRILALVVGAGTPARRRLPGRGWKRDRGSCRGSGLASVSVGAMGVMTAIPCGGWEG
jgi:hypothetical protein